MMRKTIGIAILIMLVFTLSACGVNYLEISQNISAPKNMNLPIAGEWVAEDYKLSTLSEMNEEEAESYIGTKVIFHDKFVSIGDKYFTDPSFKIKNVNASDYLIYYYKTSPEFLNIESEKVQVISISDKEQFFNEFIKVSDDVVIVNIDGVFFYLRKVSDKVETDNVKLMNLPQNISATENLSFGEEDLNSGILIGLKSLDLNEENMESWNYRTIYIRSHNKEIASIQEMDGLFFPRRSGFWKIEVIREEIDGKINDKINAYQLDKKPDTDVKMEMYSLAFDSEPKEQNTIKNILFVSNDYISIENIYYRNKGQRYLEFYHIDNIEDGNPIKISDILGEAGKEALLQGFNREMAQDMDYRNTVLDIIPNESSFGIFRRNGMWIFKGRVNYMENSSYLYKDFNINIIPTKELISFDQLLVPWKVIKSKVPEALDAFTSPNEDIAVVFTYGYILIYRIDNGTLSDEPIERIKLNSGEKVVMAEWALGKYSLLWGEQFK